MMMMVVVMKLELKVAELVFGLMGWAELRLECNPVMFDNIYHPTLVMLIFKCVCLPTMQINIKVRIGKLATFGEQGLLGNGLAKF